MIPKGLKWMYDKEGKILGKHIWKVKGKVVVSNHEDSGLFYDSSNGIPYTRKQEEK